MIWLTDRGIRREPSQRESAHGGVNALDSEAVWPGLAALGRKERRRMKMFNCQECGEEVTPTTLHTYQDCLEFKKEIEKIKEAMKGRANEKATTNG